MRSILTTIGLGLLLLGATHGQAPTTRQGKLDRDEAKAPGPRRVTDVLGSAVSLRGGTALGKVTDMVLSDDGRVDYLIVRHDGDLLPVPWGAVSLGTGGLRVTPDVTAARVRGLLFRDAGWPDFASDRWRRTAGDVWGASTLPRATAERLATPPPAGTRPASDRADPRMRKDPLLPGATGNPEDRRPLRAKDKD